MGTLQEEAGAGILGVEMEGIKVASARFQVKLLLKISLASANYLGDCVRDSVILTMARGRISFPLSVTGTGWGRNNEMSP